jgi:dolichyl-phosphate-mannose--protein O-mannosyl transferase
MPVSDGTIINEMVILDYQGAVVTPLNTANYPQLFDEQETFMPPDSLTYFGQTMFDEIYHGRTAFEFIHGLPTYETTHPPLGKSIIAGGIRLFGMNPCGWRFMTAVFGLMMLPLIYAFGKSLFHNSLAAAAVTIMLAFDFMHFALSRIATIDIFAAFFILLMYYLFYRYMQIDRSGQPTSATKHKYIYLGLAGLAMGLAIATKWTGVYAGLGLALMVLWHLINHPAHVLRSWSKTWRLLLFCVVCFVLVPLLIYALSYLPFVSYQPDKGLLQTIIDNNKSMLSYHGNLKATHYYHTRFYDWPTMRMPLLYATDSVGVDPELVSSVSCMGNPAIWWFGIPCILFSIFRFLFKKDMKAGFLVIAYLAQYLPWFAVTRITFIYHYFPASLFMILMIAYAFEKLANYKPWGRSALYAYLVVVVGLFFIFYPVISGYPSSREYQFSLRWLDSWILAL